MGAACAAVSSTAGSIVCFTTRSVTALSAAGSGAGTVFGAGALDSHASCCNCSYACCICSSRSERDASSAFQRSASPGGIDSMSRSRSRFGKSCCRRSRSSELSACCCCQGGDCSSALMALRMSRNGCGRRGGSVSLAISVLLLAWRGNDHAFGPAGTTTRRRPSLHQRAARNGTPSGPFPLRHRHDLGARVDDAVDQARQPPQGVGLLVRVLEPVVNALD